MTDTAEDRRRRRVEQLLTELTDVGVAPTTQRAALRHGATTVTATPTAEAHHHAADADQFLDQLLGVSTLR